MNSQHPKVSIGLPVYNGEPFLAEALDSILGQTFSDFELIISDNASQDRTREICLDYARRDSRIRYDRNTSNHGASRNFNRVFHLSRGRYFKWAAHDDLLAPEFLARTVEVLDRYPSVVLCFSRMRIISSTGEVQRRDFTNGLDRISSFCVPTRFGEIVLKRHGCFHIWGLLRREVLAKTPLISDHIASDRTLLARLALAGRFYEVAEELFLLRGHEERSVRVPFYLRAAWFSPSRQGKLCFPNWRVLQEYAAAIGDSPLSAGGRLRCYAQLLRWVGTPSNFTKLGLDLVVAPAPHRLWKVDQLVRHWYRRWAH